VKTRRRAGGEAHARDVGVLQHRLEVVRRHVETEVTEVRHGLTLEVPVQLRAPEVGVDHDDAAPVSANVAARFTVDTDLPSAGPGT
jgi:hypothetical protein